MIRVNPGKIATVAAVGLIVLLGAYLRFMAVRESLVPEPYRADAAQYYNSAYNLRRFGVYSHDGGPIAGQVSVPQPDAFVTPGYPLFLALFADDRPNRSIFMRVAYWQALLGTLCILLTYFLVLRMAPGWIALSAALLVAISPHLVNTGIYLLSETLFTFLLLSALLVLSGRPGARRGFYVLLLGGGVLLGIAALTRPVLEFFPLVFPLVLLCAYPRRQATIGAALVLLGFVLVWTPWLVRNQVSVGNTPGPSVMVSTLASGMYPDLEYNHNPESRGIPYRFDPRFAEVTRSLSSTLAEIARRFRENPGEELEWYLIGKPVTLWSWNVFEGGGDTFIYATLSTPYDVSLPFMLSHAVMHGLHWILVTLALAGCLFVWLPFARTRFGDTGLQCARLISLVLLYNTAIIMIFAPFVRYSIPFLPLQYGMAVVAALLAAGWLKQQRHASLVRHASRKEKPAQ